MLRSFGQAVDAYRYVIAVLVGAGLLLGLIWGLVAPKSYLATAKVYINPFFIGDNAAQMARQPTGGSSPIVENYGSLALSDSYINQAKRPLGINESADKLRLDLMAGPAGKSQFLELSAKRGSREEAAALANSLARVLIVRSADSLDRQADSLIKGLRSAYKQDPSNRVLRLRLQQIETMRVGPNPVVSLAIPASQPAKAQGLGWLTKGFAGGFAGLIVGLLVALVAGSNYRLRSRRQVEQAYDLPIVEEFKKKEGDLLLLPQNQTFDKDPDRHCQVISLVGPGGEIAARAWADKLRNQGLTQQRLVQVLIVADQSSNRPAAKLSQSDNLPEATLFSNEGNSWLIVDSNQSLEDVVDRAQPFFDAVIFVNSGNASQLAVIDLGEDRKEEVDKLVGSSVTGLVLVS